jgi:hypothetical protein
VLEELFIECPQRSLEVAIAVVFTPVPGVRTIGVISISCVEPGGETYVRNEISPSVQGRRTFTRKSKDTAPRKDSVVFDGAPDTTKCSQFNQEQTAPH